MAKKKTTSKKATNPRALKAETKKPEGIAGKIKKLFCGK